MADTPTRDRVRIYIGDTVESTPLFNDNELDLLIDDRDGNARLAAADACDALAARFARDFDFKWKDGEFKKGSRSAMYADMAKRLRERPDTGSVAAVASMPVTRVDGYSADLSSEDGAASDSTGHVRAGYFDGDLPH